MVKLVGNMHGNEAVGRELLIALARHLLQEYKEGGSPFFNYNLTTNLYLLTLLVLKHNAFCNDTIFRFS